MKRHCLKQCLQLCGEYLFLRIWLCALSIFLGTAIVGIACAKTIGCILRRNRTAALAALCKPSECERKCNFGLSRLLARSEHFLNCFKQCRRKNWLKVSVVPFSAMFDKTEICSVREHFHNGNFGKWRFFFLNNAVIRQKIRERFQGICSRGVFLKRSLDNTRFHLVRFDILSFVIIHIPERSERQPFATADFLADSTLHIFHKVVRKIFALSERHLQHEFPLRSWLKPKLRKAQRSDSSGVHQVNYPATINAIAGETIRHS